MAEAATGQRYEKLLAELVYRPLGLRDTSLPQGYRLPEPYLHGYAVDPPNAPEDVSTVLGASGVWASGGIVSTPRDLGTFIRGYAGGWASGPRSGGSSCPSWRAPPNRPARAATGPVSASSPMRRAAAPCTATPATSRATRSWPRGPRTASGR